MPRWTRNLRATRSLRSPCSSQCPAFGSRFDLLGFFVISQQGFNDRRPLLLERISCRRLPGPPVPVAGVGGVALFAVQISMDPGACRSFVLLCRFVGLVPIAFGIPPQASQ